VKQTSLTETIEVFAHGGKTVRFWSINQLFDYVLVSCHFILSGIDPNPNNKQHHFCCGADHLFLLFLLSHHYFMEIDSLIIID
jgi:hypothetical protein